MTLTAWSGIQLRREIMPETTNCPQCQRRLRVPDELIGQQVKCPSCENVFTALSGGDATPPPVPVDEAEQQPEPAPVAKPRRARREDGYGDDYEDDDYEYRRRRRHDLAPHRGGVVLAMGILSLVIFPIIFGPIAWVMGNNDLREMRAGRMDPEGKGNTEAGRICGIIGTVLGIVGLLCCAGWLVMVAGIGAAGMHR
jgi:predicted Zn finger-like uncharacterized protein